MAVEIVSEECLDVNPREVRLPATVVMTQDLRTNSGTAEHAVFTFSLAEFHNVWFELESGEIAKTFSVEETVPSFRQTFEFQAQLVEGEGTPVELAEIIETICDPNCAERCAPVIQIL
jgi:hypothetical protein